MTCRFFVVNNLSEPRVRKMCDVVDWPNVAYVPPWAVLASERHAKIVMASPNSGKTAEMLLFYLRRIISNKSLSNFDFIDFYEKSNYFFYKCSHM